MPYDPNFPSSHEELTSPAFRGQFNALNDKIDAVPVGPQGPQGPPFANAIVDGVSTLNPGEAATVTTGFDGANVHFNFGIPPGATGADGPPGPQGPVGEVSAQQLADGLAATLSSATADSSANSNPVATLDTPFTNDPPTLADMEVLRAKLNELITAMRR